MSLALDYTEISGGVIVIHTQAIKGPGSMKFFSDYILQTAIGIIGNFAPDEPLYECYWMVLK